MAPSWNLAVPWDHHWLDPEPQISNPQAVTSNTPRWPTMDATEQKLFLQQLAESQQEAEQDMSSSGEFDEDSSSSGSGKQQQAAFGHYRRKKTNKAPRKRTFIANMTKYTDIESAALESASRGVGMGMGGANSHVLGMGANPGAQFADEAGAVADAVESGSHFASSTSLVPSSTEQTMANTHFAELAAAAAAAAQQSLPWELASLPALNDHEVVWGAKQPTPAPTQPGNPLAAPQRQAAMYSDLLNAPLTADQLAMQQAMFPNWSKVPASASTSPKSSAMQQDEYAAVAAAAAAAAMAVARSTSAGSSTLQAAMSFSAAAAPAGPPKVSFDLFPELAALAGGSDMADMTMSPAAAAQACFSRAVVTGVEGGRPLPGAMAFAPAPQAAAPAAAASQLASAQSLGSAGALAAAPAATAPAPTSSTASEQFVAAGATAGWAAGHIKTPVPSRSASSSGTMAGRALAGSIPAAGMHQPASATSLASASSGQLTLATAQTPAHLASFGSAQVSNMVAAALTMAGAQQQAAAGRGRGRANTTAAGNNAGRGRGVKRAATAWATGAPAGAAVPVAATAAPAQAAVAASAAAATTAATVTDASGNRVLPSNFVVPLHGMSLAGAVVPGGAGELRVTSLVSVGAYGLVYRGRWADKDVAVKTMRTPKPGDGLSAADILRSFRHEADLLQRIAHPNIVAIKHYQDVEPVCIVQDFATHGTLGDYIHANLATAGAGLGMQPLPPASDLERAVLRRLARRLALAPDALIADLEARSVTSVLLPGPNQAHANQRLLRRYVVLLCLLRDVASAFVYLAAPPGQSLPPIIHRDVKPTNILLSAQGTALLADFGVAKFAHPNNTISISAAHSMPAAAPSGVPRLSATVSAPPPGTGSAAVAAAAAANDSELASMFTAWSDDLASWGLNGPAPAKRTRMTGPPSNPWAAPLPSADVDLSWLDSLLGAGEDTPEDAGRTGAPQPMDTDSATPAQKTASPSPTPVAHSHGSQASAATAAAPGSAGQQSSGQSSSWPNHHGTAHYAAPEDLCDNGYPLTPAADMFSFGYCIWEALTATRPWSGERAPDIAAGVGRRGARLPLPAYWPPRMAALVRRCWATDPAVRPSPSQVLSELDAEIRTALGGVL